MRKEGYYWVKQNNCDKLSIAYYDDSSWWLIIGSTMLYFESDFQFIGRRIKEPKND